MWKVRKVKSKTNAYGVSKIVRHTYNTQSGMAVKGGWWQTRATVIKRDRGLCVLCLRKGKQVKASEVHHIKPLSQGGTSTSANLISVCYDCHNRKHIHLFRNPERRKLK